MPRPKGKHSDTKAKILKAATELFSEHGYAATAISQIAQAAGVNQSLIYHHFSDKQDLWRKVKHSFFEFPGAPSLRTLDQHIDSMRTLSELLDWFIRQRMLFLEQNPNLVSILQWQLAECDAQALANYGRFTPFLRQKIKQLQDCGEISKQINIDFIMLLLHILPVMSLTGETMLGLKPASSIDSLVQQIETVLTCGLAGVGDNAG